MEVFEKRLYHQCYEEHLSRPDLVVGRLSLPFGTSRMMAYQDLVIDGGVAVI